jgi:hypothetical protein
MGSKYHATGIVLVLFSLFFISIQIPQCQANLGNVATMQEGSSFHNGTLISMPSADVDINITRNGDYAIVNMTATFLVYTNITQNATLAFVYPSFASSVNESVTNGTMQIQANGTLMNYSIVYWDDFIESGFNDQFWYEVPYIHPFADFAVFNLELMANTTLVFTIVSDSVFLLTNINVFQYRYIVGSARTFEGDTHEKVHLHIIEETPFLELVLYPNETLILTQDGIVTDATWEFDISEFTLDCIYLNAQVRPSPTTFIDFGWTLIIGGIFVILFLFIKLVRQRGND